MEEQNGLKKVLKKAEGGGGIFMELQISKKVLKGYVKYDVWSVE